MRRLLPDLGTLIAFVAAIPVARASATSFDLFFHLASGRWLLEHGSFPKVDPFSLTASEPQFPHEYAFGIVAELSLRVFGAAGPELFCAALVAGGLLLAWRTL